MSSLKYTWPACLLLSVQPAWAETLVESARESDESAAPPQSTAKAALPEPRADEQNPKPYFAPAEREPRLERLDLGPDVGVVYRPAEGNTISYSAGFRYGAHARVEILKWLGMRAIVAKSNHAVSVPTGALLPGTDAEQPSLDVLEFGLRVEPTWPVHERARLWLGLGGVWERVSTERPTLSGRRVQGSDRSGVAVEYSAALGGTLDVLPNWLAIGVAISASWVASQSGSLFEPLQAVDENVSRPQDPLVYLAGLPEFEAAYSAVLSLGLLL